MEGGTEKTCVCGRGEQKRCLCVEVCGRGTKKVSVEEGNRKDACLWKRGTEKTFVSVEGVNRKDITEKMSVWKGGTEKTSVSDRGEQKRCPCLWKGGKEKTSVSLGVGGGEWSRKEGGAA